MPTLAELLKGGHSALQGASNAALSNLTGPVDLLALLLRKGGVPIPEAPMGGSEWAKRAGLYREPENKMLGMLGEGVGLAAPFVGVAKAPQIAAGMLQADEALQPVASRAIDSYMDKIGGKLGVVEKSPYSMEHRPMTTEGGASRLHDLLSAFGDDIYGKNALQYFGSGHQLEPEVLKIVQGLRGKPDAMVDIFRGAPKEASKINPGDWVTLSPKIASDYGPNVLQMKVPASHVTAWPDSLLEYGYYPK